MTSNTPGEEMSGKGPNLMTSEMLEEKRSLLGQGLTLSVARHTRAFHPGDLQYLVCHSYSAHICLTAYHITFTSIVTKPH